MKRLLLFALLLLLIAWGVAYWFAGVDVKYISGLIRSRFQQPTSISIVENPSANVSVKNNKKFIGFHQEVVASGFIKPTRMAFEPDTNDLFVAELDGKVYRLTNDGSKHEVASGFNQLLGISFDPAEKPAHLLAASREMVSILERQNDGTYGSRNDLVIGLPAGRHQTDLALVGPDNRIYIATGSRSDRGEIGIAPREASILVVDQDGDNLRLFAKGLRNPFAMVFDGNKLLVSDNGQDVPANGVPDELNVVEDGNDYGWPTCWGVQSGSNCSGKTPPIALLQEHSSADGFAVYHGTQFPEEYRGNVFIALWGANSKDPDIGKKVVRAELPTQAGGLGRVTDFVTGLNHPIDVKVDPKDGSLLILDYGSGEVMRVTAKYESR